MSLTEALKKQLAIKRLSLHSQRIGPHCAYVAIPGQQQDGRNFIVQAIENGAQALIVESEGLTASQRAQLAQSKVPVFYHAHLAKDLPELAASFYEHPSQHQRVIAVTGTNGKSSIAHGLNQFYAQYDVPCAMIGTLGIGPLAALAPNPLTTPDPITLQESLAQFYHAGIETIAMEASSHALAQGRLSATAIDVAVYTNLTQDHLDYHHTMENYGAAKALLYQMPSVALVIINLDDPWCWAQVERIPAHKAVIGYTLQGKSHPRCAHLWSATHLPTGEIRVSEGENHQVIRPRLMGAFNLSNLLAMMAVMQSEGFPFASICRAAGEIRPIPGRLEWMGGEGQPTVVVDFAHTPDALMQVLKTLRQHTVGRLWCVFGCGGDRDASKRPQMGAIAQQGADEVIVTSDNPRSEEPEAIVRDILAGMQLNSSVRVIVDRQKAIAHAVANAAINDTVLIAGKGHEKCQIIGKTAHPFDDVAVACDELKQRK